MNAGQLTFEDAIRLVEAAADPDWKHHARNVILELAAAGTFTADDFWDRIETDHPTITTHEKRALGATITRAQRHQLIAHTGRYVDSRRRRAKVPVWAAGPTLEVTAIETRKLRT